MEFHPSFRLDLVFTSQRKYFFSHNHFSLLVFIAPSLPATHPYYRLEHTAAHSARQSLPDEYLCFHPKTMTLSESIKTKHTISAIDVHSKRPKVCILYS